MKPYNYSEIKILDIPLEGIELIPESIVIINNNTVSIRITNQIDLRFAGNLLIIKG